MRKRRIKTILSVIAIATMMLSSMGIGVFAEVEQTAPAVQAQGNGDSDNGDATVGDVTEAEETPVVTEEEAATAEPEAPASELNAKGDDDGDGEGDDEELPEPVFENGVTSVRTVSGHQCIKVVWAPVQATVTINKEVPKVDPETGESITNPETGEPETEIVPETEYIDPSYYTVWRKPARGSWQNYATVSVDENGKVAVSGIATYSSYSTSTLWTKDIATAGVVKSGDKITSLYFEDKDVGDGLMDNATKSFRGGDWVYMIIPSIDEEGYAPTTCTAACKATAPDSCVRTSYVALKIKVNKNLKSHDYQHRTLKLKKGTTIYTCAFGFGRYQFIHGGNMYWLNRVGTKSHKSGYDKNHPYTAEEAAYYVNTSPYGGSSTSKLVWVNTYVQRIYVFQGSRGNWTLLNWNGSGGHAGWYVSTGKAATPTIRYMDPKSRVLDSGRIVGKCKTINKKVKKRHGIPCWNCFSTWNAIHGQKKSWSIKGVPKSNGCVRNTNANAKYIYNTCPKNTRVLIF